MRLRPTKLSSEGASPSSAPSVAMIAALCETAAPAGVSTIEDRRALPLHVVDELVVRARVLKYREDPGQAPEEPRARGPVVDLIRARSLRRRYLRAARQEPPGHLAHRRSDERRSDVVKVLLGTSDVDARNARLFTPLHLCAGALASLPRPSPKDAETAALCVNLLIKHGANPNLLDDAGRAPLHLACLQTGTLKIVEALIEGGADPTQQTTDGWLAVDAAHTVGALTDELRRLLTKAVTLKAPEGHAFVDDVDD